MAAENPAKKKYDQFLKDGSLEDTPHIRAAFGCGMSMGVSMSLSIDGTDDGTTDNMKFIVKKMLQAAATELVLGYRNARMDAHIQGLLDEETAHTS